MIKMIKKRYISNLCGKYGNPQDVRDKLLTIVNKYPFLNLIFKNDINRFDQEVEKEHKLYLENRAYVNERRGSCYDCPYGNGEGGCTIGGCEY